MKKIRIFRKTDKNRAFLRIASLLPAVFAVCMAVYYILGPGEGYFHSDCSDSLYWANASVESGKVFDESFRYAGLLPFSASLWMIPLIRIFGFGITAHNIAMVLFAVLFAGAVWFCCRAAGMEDPFCGIAVFAVFAVLSSSDKLREILWGHTIYYSVGLIILFCGAGLLLRTLSGLEKKKYAAAGIFAGLLFLLSAGCATDGAQVIVLGVLPLGAAAVAERVFCREDGLLDRRTRHTLVPLAAILLGTAVGLLMLRLFKGEHISAGYADAYSGWSDVSAWADNAKAFVKQFCTLIGAVPGDAKSLFSRESVGPILRIALGILILGTPVGMLICYKKLSCRGVKILLWAHFVETAAILFGFICGKLSGANWRLTPMVGSAALLTVCGIRELCVYRAGRAQNASTAETADVPEFSDASVSNFSDAQPAFSDASAPEKKNAPRSGVSLRVGVLLLALLVAASCVSYLEIAKMPADYGRDNYNHRLAAFLERQGLEYGYATFWYCQTVTVITESRVKCREILASRTEGVYTDLYQSSRNWYGNNDYDRYFVVLSQSEYDTVSHSAAWADACVYRVAEYTARSSEEEQAGLGVYGFVITVFSRNIVQKP